MGNWVINATPHVEQVSEYPTILAVCIILSALMAFVVGLRAYVRGFMMKSVGPDDYAILFSAVCSIIYSALCIDQSRWGLGLPIALRPKPNLNPYSVVNFAGRPFYMAGITGFKVALCFAYLRILRGNANQLYKTLIWTVMITCVMGHLAGTLVLIFQCKPVQRSWYPSTPGTCLPNDSTFYGLAAVTIFFDVFIFFLPIPALLKLQINSRRKFALVGIFLLGLLTTVCSVMRMIQIIQISKDGNSTMLVLWGTVEMNVGIILTCIPTLTPLFKYFSNKGRSNYDDPTYGHYGNNNSIAGGRAFHKKEYDMQNMSGSRAGKSGPHRLRGETLLSSTVPMGKGDMIGTMTSTPSGGMFRKEKHVLDDSSSGKTILGLESAVTSDHETEPPSLREMTGEGEEYDPSTGEILKTTDVVISVEDGGAESGLGPGRGMGRSNGGHSHGPSINTTGVERIQPAYAGGKW